MGVPLFFGRCTLPHPFRTIDPMFLLLFSTTHRLYRHGRHLGFYCSIVPIVLEYNIPIATIVLKTIGYCSFPLFLLFFSIVPIVSAAILLILIPDSTTNNIHAWTISVDQ